MLIGSRAKINLSLRILGIQQDLHLLDSVACSIDCYDTINIKFRQDKQICVEFTNSNINPINNTVYKVCKYVVDKFDLLGFDIVVNKNIPIMAGLGGSSSNAGSLLYVFSQLYNLELDYSEIVQIGSDIPYMIGGGLCRISGIGENVKKIQDCAKIQIVVVKKGNVSTKDCFYHYDNIDSDKICNKSNCNYINSLVDNNTKIMQNNSLIDALINYDINNIKNNAYNDLTICANHINDSILKNIDTLYNYGAFYANMSGSGAACYGLFESSVDTRRLEYELRKKDIIVFTTNTTCASTIMLD